MGLFKSLRELNKQSAQIAGSWDPAAQMRDAQAQMSAAGELLEEQTAAANAATNGVAATATIVSVRQLPAMVNLQPTIEVDLTVVADGIPYPATVRQVIPHVHLARAQPGTTVRVKVDPHDRAAVWIDWSIT